MNEHTHTPEKQKNAHHHSHHHHHHSHRRRSKKESKFKRFLRHNKKTLLRIAGVMVIITLIVLIAVLLDGHIAFREEPSEEGNGGVRETNATIQLEIPFFPKEVSLVSPAVAAYMKAEDETSIHEIIARYDNEEDSNRLDVGMPVSLSYTVTGIPDGYSVKKAEFVVSEYADFSASKVYTPAPGKTGVDVYHLKAATTYYYRVDLTLSNGSVTGASGSFKTADTPRILSVEGVYNLRDIGGWKTASGKAIKQGVLYRGTELDGTVDSLYSITPNGVNTMLATFGIRTDMDLRFSEDNPYGSDALGAGVQHIYYGAQMYSDIFGEEGKAAMKKLFSDLADESNYPVYLHCTQGLDRTGTACYVLEALLGVSEEDLMRDYLLSALHHKSLWAMDQMNTFVADFNALKGNDLQEKAEGYLLSIGVTAAEIESIRNIFLGA